MFEDRRRKKTKRVIFFIFLLFISVSFAVGYYLNLEPVQNADSGDLSGNVGYVIPESLINPNSINSTKINTNEMDSILLQNNAGETASILDKDLVGADTEFVFKTTYAQCGHTLERKAIPRANEINMNEASIANCYTNWLLESFSKEKAVFIRQIDTHCPNHFIIGIYGGNIGIFVYNQDGEKILKEETDIPISAFTPEDQGSLQRGIIADTEEELNMKLEGFSD